MLILLCILLEYAKYLSISINVDLPLDRRPETQEKLELIKIYISVVLKKP